MSEKISVILKEEELQNFENFLKQTGLSKSSAIRLLLKLYLQKLNEMFEIENEKKSASEIKEDGHNNK